MVIEAFLIDDYTISVLKINYHVSIFEDMVVVAGPHPKWEWLYLEPPILLFLEITAACQLPYNFLQ